MKTTFRLKRPDSDSATRIYIDIVHKNRRARFYTELSILPTYWNQSKQIATARRTDYEHAPHLKGELKNINTDLHDYKGDANDYKKECDVKGHEITAKGLKNYLENKYKAAKLVGERTPFLTNYMKTSYIPRVQRGEITFTKKNQRLKFQPSTIKVKNQSLNAFKEFEKENGKIRFDDINMKFYHDFVSWHEKKNLTINYIGRLIKEMKVILRQAYKDGLHSNKIADNDEFATLKEDVPAVYLTVSELDRIQALKLEGRLAYYRDMMLVGSYTALRFSDYSRIRPEHIKDTDHGKCIDIVTQKTKERVIVPISKKIIHILTDPAYFEHKKVYQQKFNYKIKDICELAEIDEPIEVVRIVGGLTKITTVPKYELVKSHTMRRTGATNMYNGFGGLVPGIPPLTIMQFTGHKTETAFLKYIRETKQETARRLETHPVFTYSLSVVK